MRQRLIDEGSKHLVDFSRKEDIRVEREVAIAEQRLAG